MSLWDELGDMKDKAEDLRDDINIVVSSLKLYDSSDDKEYILDAIKEAIEQLDNIINEIY